MAEAIARLAADPALRVRLGTAARQMALQDWDKSKVLAGFERELISLTAGQKASRPAQSRWQGLIRYFTAS